MQLTKDWAAMLDDYAIDLAWSPDGAHLAAASAAGPVSIFARDGAKLHELAGHEIGTNCLAWSPRSIRKPAEKSKLATGGQDGTVKIWSTESSEAPVTAKLGAAWIDHLAWRPAPPAEVEKNSLPDQGVEEPPQNSFEFGSIDSGTQLLDSGSEPRNLGLLGVTAGRNFILLNSDGSTRHTFAPAAKTITALAWQPAGGCAAVAWFGGVALWDADDLIAQKQFPYANGIHALVWSPDSKWLVSGNQDPSVHLWIPEEDIELHMSGYEGKVKHLSFDHTSRWLATAGGRDACIWDCAGTGPEGREPAMFPHEAPVCALAFQHGHGLLASASQDGVVMLWSPERKNPLRATVRMPVAASKLVWSPDDRLLAIGSEKGAIYVLKCEA